MIQLGILKDLSVQASNGQFEVADARSCALVEGAKTANKNTAGTSIFILYNELMQNRNLRVYMQDRDLHIYVVKLS